MDSKHGHELEAACVLLWDTLRASRDISTRTPYCSTVCLCQYDTSVTHSRQPAAQTQPAVVGASGGEIQDEIPQDVCVYGELEELVV